MSVQTVKLSPAQPAITEELRRNGQVKGFDGGQREGDHGMHAHEPGRDPGGASPDIC